MRIIVLGSGTSQGIPVVGCFCPVCTSNDERDKRMRSSVYIEGSGGERVLIDVGPEFRLQAIRAGISRLDAVFLTHSHADHIYGLDDLRPLSREKPIPVYGNEQTVTEMKGFFSYVFYADMRNSQEGGGKPKLIPRIVDGPVHIGSLKFTPVPVKHGVLDILGWEVSDSNISESSSVENTGKSFLYLTDTSAIPPASMAELSGGEPRIIIIGGLRKRPHETHFSFEQALDAALSIRAKAIYLTHICHNHSHTEIEEFCRDYRETHCASNGELKNVEIHPAQDGLELTL
jgi:phosphoribosyl 1,2-cyclic phosphate phosphodiesterase